MQREARLAGERLIAAEAAIEAAFRAGSLANDELRTLIHDAERARADLRFIHLSRHLETLPLLTTAQIDRYNELRGYGGAGACEQDGPGHDHAARHRAADCGG